ncbi:MAG: hypothetical protein HYX26_01745 [Acidobacteriales bacterium]|nr:hypothetical protein [Terriglobales bacterium]
MKQQKGKPMLHKQNTQPDAAALPQYESGPSLFLPETKSVIDEVIELAEKVLGQARKKVSGKR